VDQKSFLKMGFDGKKVDQKKRRFLFREEQMIVE
jgi:hypothetical protein